MSIVPVSIPTKTLAQNLSSAGTTLYLNNTLGWDGDQLTSANFGTQLFATLRNAANDQVEFIELDPATVTSANSITILKRGLGYDGTQVASTETAYTWNAFDTLVELGADTPQMIQWLKDYIDGISIAGAPDASTTAKGLTEEATQAEVDAGTTAGSTAARLMVNPSTLRAKQYHDYAVDTAGTDAYTITITPAITAYAAGQVFTFKAITANTGACTLNVSGLGAKDIKKNYNEALVTGDILANQVVVVVYDGTNMQVLSKLPSPTPTVQTYTTASTTLGGVTTRFDITNPSGTTFRYTWDTTGTDPGITTSTVPTGIPVVIKSTAMTVANTGCFLVTGSGANYFEITNASGVAENDVALTNGYLKTVTAQTWTKPANLKYAIVEVQGAGAAGSGSSTGETAAGSGGGGAYSKKLIAAASLGATETLYVGPGGVSVTTGEESDNIAGSLSKFGSHLTAPGGTTATTTVPGGGGTASGGDVNISGQNGTTQTTRGSGDAIMLSAPGGNSFLGLGGPGISVSTTATNGQAGKGYGGGGSAGADAAIGGDGAPGIIIVTEYYS